MSDQNSTAAPVKLSHRINLLFRMLMAALYDSVLVLAFCIVVFMPVGTLETFIAGYLSEHLYWAWIFQWAKTLILFMALFVYFIVSVQRMGQTIGMKAWRLKLIPRDTIASGKHIFSIKLAFYHCLLTLIFLPLFFSILFNRNGKTIPNLIDNTSIQLLAKNKP